MRDDGGRRFRLPRCLSSRGIAVNELIHNVNVSSHIVNQWSVPGSQCETRARRGPVAGQFYYRLSDVAQHRQVV